MISANALSKIEISARAPMKSMIMKMSITDLAFKLGYAEPSVFSRSFKQWTGLSPRQWQQRHLG